MTTKNKSYFSKLEKEYGQLTFGNLLRSFREADDFTQVEFSKKLGISNQNLNDLENGRKIPSACRAAKIAKILSIPEKPLIELAIKDSLLKDGFEYSVSLTVKKAS